MKLSDEFRKKTVDDLSEFMKSYVKRAFEEVEPDDDNEVTIMVLESLFKEFVLLNAVLLKGYDITPLAAGFMMNGTVCSVLFKHAEEIAKYDGLNLKD